MLPTASLGMDAIVAWDFEEHLANGFQHSGAAFIRVSMLTILWRDIEAQNAAMTVAQHCSTDISQQGEQRVLTP